MWATETSKGLWHLRLDLHVSESHSYPSGLIYCSCWWRRGNASRWLCIFACSFGDGFYCKLSSRNENQICSHQSGTFSTTWWNRHHVVFFYRACFIATAAGKSITHTLLHNRTGWAIYFRRETICSFFVDVQQIRRHNHHRSRRPFRYNRMWSCPRYGNHLLEWWCGGVLSTEK